MKVLFVDDEPNILDGLMRLMRPMRDRWQMAFATGGAEALEMLRTSAVDLVVSDMRMPGMSGLELLEAVKADYPDTIRFVLSGQTDRDTAIRSTNIAHQFLTKPCDPEVLVAAVDRAANLRGVLQSEELRTFACKLQTIPSLPASYFRLAQEMESPEPSIARVAEIIEQDVGMTATVLHMVNSSFFGLPRRVERAAEAASLLGLDTLKALMTAVHVFGVFKSQAVDGFDLEALHRHCMHTGAIALAIAKSESLDRVTVGQALMAGVLHDLGTMMLASGLPGALAAIRYMSEKTLEPQWTCEEKLFGTSHAELGGYLLGLWGFPFNIIEAVVYHHRPSLHTSAGVTLTDIVHGANGLEHTIVQMEERDPAALDRVHFERKGLTQNLQQWHTLALEITGLVQGNDRREAA
jgi:HD-like signal output (HDOD) protein/CheY-like chemotaxis protein